MAVKETALEIVHPERNELSLLELAIEKNLDLDKLKQFMDLRDRYQAEKAKTAFVAAMNAFKRNPPNIVRDRPSEHGRYAGLDTICKAVMGALSEQGISHRWEYDQKGPDWIDVTCILTHESGHSERTKMGGPPDAAGPKGNATKNPIQALASTRTYLERYTLLGAVGLESAYDDDGNGGELTNGELTEQLEYIDNASTPDELKRLYKVAYEMFEANPAALKQIIAARKARKEDRAWQ